MNHPIAYRLPFIILALLSMICACTPSRPRPAPGMPKAYKVLGAWYQPIRDAKGFTQEGIASWYGPNFHGKKTASGEIYDMHALTAAHTTLPLGTHVRVRNLSNGKEVTVRVNDRGPFVKGRIIDLSFMAAKTLDLIGKGTGRVAIRALTKVPQSPKPDSVSNSSGTYTLQVGFFSRKTNAEALVARLSEHHESVHLKAEPQGFKVRVGRFDSRDDAEKIKARLGELGYSAFTVPLN